MHVSCSYMVSTDPNNFIHGIYSSKYVYTIFSRNKKTCIIAGLEPMTLCILTSCHNHLATSVIAMTGRVIVYVYSSLDAGPGCRTSGAGSASPPSPAMTSPARASKRIALKPWPPGLWPLATWQLRCHCGSTVTPNLTTRPCVKMPRKYWFRVRLSGTSHEIRFDAVAKHNKTICVGRYLNKTSGTKKLKS